MPRKTNTNIRLSKELSEILVDLIEGTEENLNGAANRLIKEGLANNPNPPPSLQGLKAVLPNLSKEELINLAIAALREISYKEENVKDKGVLAITLLEKLIEKGGWEVKDYGRIAKLTDTSATIVREILEDD